MTTMTINDKLEELGTLVNNTKQSLQRSGAEMIEAFFNTHKEGDNVDGETTAQLLYYLTDIQVRDYALGLLNVDNSDKFISALTHLINAAPEDSAYINPPSTLLSVMWYEMRDVEQAHAYLSKAKDGYALKQLLARVYAAGWDPSMFHAMRTELHPKVTAGIFGDNK